MLKNSCIWEVWCHGIIIAAKILNVGLARQLVQLKDSGKWQSKAIRIQTKTRILSVCVMSVLLYAAETWTLKKRDMN